VDNISALAESLPAEAWTTAIDERVARRRDWWPLTVVRTRRSDESPLPDVVLTPRTTVYQSGRVLSAAARCGGARALRRGLPPPAAGAGGLTGSGAATLWVPRNAEKAR
jgi:hypothetical protein